jgi:hypothetical protein
MFVIKWMRDIGVKNKGDGDKLMRDDAVVLKDVGSEEG